ncbi:hypothetical protein [Arthrobacter sp. B3I4]|uniref:hypothetical protein n=1 Tax=Arthrobacter sp. B3I4 TaxID=3042267 RepID=UPI002781F193|nr:hypothetical protein [Arthrobacter sp. B3I4]MDQ0756072.1 hypothetical protein [Arthrobacter sp. B3I4]
MSRRINLDKPNLPDPQCMAWLEANGIDPSGVPAAQEVLVEDDQITLVEYVRSLDGFKLPVHDSNGELCGWKKHLVTVPMLSAPENHGL